jgi:hypothetical protein
MSNRVVVAALYAAAAVAEALAIDYEKGRLWEGDLKRKIADITAYLQVAQREETRP